MIATLNKNILGAGCPPGTHVNNFFPHNCIPDVVTPPSGSGSGHPGIVVIDPFPGFNNGTGTPAVPPINPVDTTSLSASMPGWLWLAIGAAAYFLLKK